MEAKQIKLEVVTNDRDLYKINKFVVDLTASIRELVKEVNRASESFSKIGNGGFTKMSTTGNSTPGTGTTTNLASGFNNMAGNLGNDVTRTLRTNKDLLKSIVQESGTVMKVMTEQVKKSVGEQAVALSQLEKKLENLHKLDQMDFGGKSRVDQGELSAFGIEVAQRKASLGKDRETLLALSGGGQLQSGGALGDFAMGAAGALPYGRAILGLMSGPAAIGAGVISAAYGANKLYSDYQQSAVANRYQNINTPIITQMELGGSVGNYAISSLSGGTMANAFIRNKIETDASYQKFKKIQEEKHKYWEDNDKYKDEFEVALYKRYGAQSFLGSIYGMAMAPSGTYDRNITEVRAELAKRQIFTNVTNAEDTKQANPLDSHMGDWWQSNRLGYGQLQRVLGASREFGSTQAMKSRLTALGIGVGEWAGARNSIAGIAGWEAGHQMAVPAIQWADGGVFNAASILGQAGLFGRANASLIKSGISTLGGRSSSGFVNPTTLGQLAGLGLGQSLSGGPLANPMHYISGMAGMLGSGDSGIDAYRFSLMQRGAGLINAGPLDNLQVGINTMAAAQAAPGQGVYAQNMLANSIAKNPATMAAILKENTPPEVLAKFGTKENAKAALESFLSTQGRLANVRYITAAAGNGPEAQFARAIEKSGGDPYSYIKSISKNKKDLWSNLRMEGGILASSLGISEADATGLAAQSYIARYLPAAKTGGGVGRGLRGAAREAAITEAHKEAGEAARLTEEADRLKKLEREQQTHTDDFFGIRKNGEKIAADLEYVWKALELFLKKHPDTFLRPKLVAK